MTRRFKVVGGTMLVLLAASALAAAPAAEDAANAPCRIHQRVAMAFPYRALSEGVIRGEAVLMLDVDRAGQLVDVLVTAYTRREFADAALEAVKEWRFTPARLNNEPVGSTITLNAQFEITGVLAYVKPVGVAETTDEAFDERFAYRAYPLNALDRVPTAREQPGPIYPREWIIAGRTGAVTVEFFIDEKGGVRFPRVLNEADEYLGMVSLAAVRQWRFTPPLRKGRPVLARVSQVFQFDPKTERNASPERK